MGNKGRWEYLRAIYERYQKAGRRAKKVILNEFCANTGYHRKYAIRLLNGARPEKRRSRRERERSRETRGSGAREPTGSERYISVEKKQYRRSRHFGASVPRARRAPILRKLKQPHVIARRDLIGVIGRAVIDDNYLNLIRRLRS